MATHKEESEPSKPKALHHILQSKEENLRRSFGVDDFDLPLPTSGEFVHNKSLAIKVDDPRRGGTMVERTYSFAVHGSGSLFKEQSFSVRRFFGDFAWLEKTLVAKYPYLLVPTLVKKKRNFNTVDEKGALIVGAELRMFLNRVASHPILVKTNIFRNFLQMQPAQWAPFKKETDEQQASKPHLENAARVASRANAPTLDNLNPALTNVIGGVAGHPHEKGNPSGAANVTNDQLHKLKTQVENIAKAISEVQNAILQASEKAKDHSESLLFLATGFSKLIPEFEGQKIMRELAQVQHSEASELFKNASRDKAESHEMIKGWYSNALAAKELISRFESAQDIVDFYTKELAQRQKTKMAAQEISKTESALATAKDLLGKYTLFSMKELDRVLDEGKAEKAHWAKYYAAMKVDYMQAQLNAWMGYLDTVDTYQQEMDEKHKKAEKLKALEKASPFRVPLKEIMQKQKQQYPNLKVPHLVHFLCDFILKNGLNSMGIFRISCDAKEIRAGKQIIEQQEDYVSAFVAAGSLLSPFLAANLLKMWVADTPNPILPKNFYQEAIDLQNPTSASLASLLSKFPEENREIIYQIVRLSRCIAENETANKMSLNNLAIIFSPNLCRCPDVNMLLANTKKETNFVLALFMYLDVEGSKQPSGTPTAPVTPSPATASAVNAAAVTANIRASRALGRRSDYKPPPQLNTPPLTNSSKNNTTDKTAEKTTARPQTTRFATTPTAAMPPTPAQISGGNQHVGNRMKLVSVNTASAAMNAAFASMSGKDATGTGTKRVTQRKYPGLLGNRGEPPTSPAKPGGLSSTLPSMSDTHNGIEEIEGEEVVIDDKSNDSPAQAPTAANRTPMLDTLTIDDDYLADIIPDGIASAENQASENPGDSGQADAGHSDHPDNLLDEPFQVVAIGNYIAQSENEIGILDGHTYTVIELEETNQWYHVVDEKGDDGWCPISWCKTIKENSISSSSSASSASSENLNIDSLVDDISNDDIEKLLQEIGTDEILAVNPDDFVPMNG